MPPTTDRRSLRSRRAATSRTLGVSVGLGLLGPLIVVFLLVWASTYATVARRVGRALGRMAREIERWR